jgi:hypothetical protein
MTKQQTAEDLALEMGITPRTAARLLASDTVSALMKKVHQDGYRAGWNDREGRVDVTKLERDEGVRPVRSSSTGRPAQGP